MRTLSASLKHALAGEVRALFNDRALNEQPVVPSDDALFARGSVIRRVHADVTTMMIGGIAALLLQMLHPSALAGIWDHSRFRADMLGRLRRTARFIAITTYAERREAEAAIATVNAIHARIRGVRPDGAPYSAADPALLAWVHVTEALCFLDAWQRYGNQPLSPRDETEYFRQFGEIAGALGVAPISQGRADAEALVERFRPSLAATARSRDVARLILSPTQTPLHLLPAQRITGGAALDLLPRWAARMHGLAVPLLLKPAVRAGAFGLAGTLRWAFREPSRSA